MWSTYAPAEVGQVKYGGNSAGVNDMANLQNQQSRYLTALKANASQNAYYAKKKLTSEYQSAYNQAKAENQKRYDEGLAINDKMISMYSPGGGYGAGAMASYESGKNTARSKYMQGLVNSGMANLTKGGGFDKSYEKEIGSQFRLNLNDMQTDALRSAYSDKASWIYNREDSYPDTSMYVQLMQQLGNA